MLRKPKEGKDEEKALLTFLRRTREGKYAPIEKNSLPYARITEESEIIESSEEEYYYSIS